MKTASLSAGPEENSWIRCSNNLADAQTFLAHVGPVPTALSVPGLTIEPATLTSNLEE